jgi:glycosyltransferase involved in cell wall biosynthesis
MAHVARLLMVVRPSEGGAFGHVARLSSELVSRGNQVAICGPHESESSLDPRVEVIYLEMVQPISPIRDGKALAGLAGVIRSWRPDLIHVHGSKAGTLGRLARYADPSVPLAFTPHQYAFANYFKRRWARSLYKAIERAMAPLTTMVICVCEAERENAVKIGSGDRARVVYNGISFTPADEPEPRLAALRERGPVICAVAELHPRKGLLTLLDSMAGVLAVHPDATLAIAGEGIHRETLLRRVAELGIAPSVRLLGLVGDVPAVLAGADVFVNAAWAEAFPYSVLEAMAAQRPIVATDVGGTREAIEDNLTGRLVAPFDTDGLTSAILDLLDDREKAERLATAARERMIERFTFEGMVAGTLEAYAELRAMRPA